MPDRTQTIAEDNTFLSEIRVVMRCIAHVVEMDALGELLEQGKEAKLTLDAKRIEFDVAEHIFRELKLLIKDELRNIGVTGSKKEGIATVTITKKTVPTVRDWDAFYEWIHQEELPQILQKRVLQSGFKELRDQGIEIPGVEDFELEDLHFKILSDK